MILRKKHGRGFTYKDSNNNTICDKKLRQWIESLAIPPAWKNVQISEDKHAKVLATGRDDAGRKQYIYNPSAEKRREKKKHNHLVSFAEKLSKIRHITSKHLQNENLSKENVLACMVVLIDTAYFRPGNSYYSKKNESFGLTTLRSKHLTIDKEKLIFKYQGKSGITQIREVTNTRLTEIVRTLDEKPGYEIFQFEDENGDTHKLTSTDLNGYIQGIMGSSFSAKDFRTWGGTMLVAVALDEIGPDEEEKVNKQNVTKAIKQVAKVLGNTPAITKSSYIDPHVINHYLNGRTIQHFRKPDKNKSEKNLLSWQEQAVLRMLKKNGGTK